MSWDGRICSSAANPERRLIGSVSVLPCGHSGILQLLMLCSISPEHSPTRPLRPSSIRRRRVLDDLEPHVAEHEDQEPHADHAQPPREKGLQGRMKGILKEI